jgi:hypothetical protein
MDTGNLNIDSTDFACQISEQEFTYQLSKALFMVAQTYVTLSNNEVSTIEL